VVFLILRNIDAATLAVLWNMKIVITAFLLRVMMGRKLRPVQWSALVLLTFGVTFSNWDKLGWDPMPCDDPGGRCEPSRQRPAYAAGVLATVIACMMTATANVVEEKLLKGGLDVPLYCQNVVLYCWGVFFNLTAMLFRVNPSGGEQPSRNPFEGYDLLALCIIVTQAASGILISATFKHVSNIAALYAHAVSMIMIAIFTPTSASVFFVGGMVIVILSLLIFYHRDIEARWASMRTRYRNGSTLRNSTGGFDGTQGNNFPATQASPDGNRGHSPHQHPLHHPLHLGPRDLTPVSYDADSFGRRSSLSGRAGDARGQGPSTCEAEAARTMHDAPHAHASGTERSPSSSFRD